MANVKITDLTALTTPAAADLLEIVDDVAGTPTSKKITWANLFKAPVMITPALGTPASGVLTNCTELPLTGLLATAWTTPAFDAGVFTASESQTWTVAEADVGAFAYLITGKMMTLIFDLQTTTVGGTPSYALQITVPASKTATKAFRAPVYIDDNGSVATGILQMAGTSIYLYRPAIANWSASTNNTRVAGSVAFEIN